MDQTEVTAIIDELIDQKVLLKEMDYEGGAWNSVAEAKQLRTVNRVRELEEQLEEAGYEQDRYGVWSQRYSE
ncbi:hypothetical protein SEA_NICEHOUSE_232 [Rhodococcus phage NiceHouse]|nr:hypothetical protein SEA_NICEHOUSE_232 [Rhodococcus phage NiceHouse]